ncbi:vancomycin high temperature exclusion protein [Glaesserella sp.]|uniref:SanA/YdcF family protein n=2 Tax=Glaesserella sp. TaxID=2094731 RepID=UPI0035A08B39
MRSLRWGMVAVFALLSMMLVIDIGTGYLVRDSVYTSVEKIPKKAYAVVLGTAKYYLSGSPNLYYKYRLDAAKQLFDSGKVDYLLMSGDNRTAYYNEPKMMTNDLLRMGIPATSIKQDYAGFNTLDSIIRADKVFQLDPFIIISQQFHCERALLIAKFRNIDAICYVAKYPDAHYKVRIREFFARTAMAINLLIGADASTLEPSQIVEPSKK